MWLGRGGILDRFRNLHFYLEEDEIEKTKQFCEDFFKKIKNNSPCENELRVYSEIIQETTRFAQEDESIKKLNLDIRDELEK